MDNWLPAGSSERGLRLAGVSRGPSISIFVDGQEVEAYTGETVAAVLLASHSRALFRAPEHDHPNRLFCGMGVCHQCLVSVDAVSNVRACMTPVRPGMRIETRPSS